MYDICILFKAKFLKKEANFYKRSYRPILRYLYTEAIKLRQGELSLHKHFKGYEFSVADQRARNSYTCRAHRGNTIYHSVSTNQCVCYWEVVDKDIYAPIHSQKRYRFDASCGFYRLNGKCAIKLYRF